ncbi:MAG: PHP domain-containing protein, partial [Pseudomonadota bacterium]|nr:PHP domain-containing protein [Pseudomonadota bacterium]
AELSQIAILAAIRAGHVFVDVAGSPDRLLELTARAAGASAMMGDSLRAPAGASVECTLRVAHAAGADVVVLLDGEPAALVKDGRVGSDDARRDFAWTSDGKRHWLRVDVRSADGKLLLLGNPIYLN